MARSGSCSCDIAANFGLRPLGIFSANLRVGTSINITESGLVLLGPTMGSLAISAYTITGKDLRCPGRAGTSFEWIQKIACDPYFRVYMLPGGRAKAYEEGDVPTRMQPSGCDYETFSASATSGPHTPVLRYNHSDGYDLIYSGGPISVGSESGKTPTNVDFLKGILPNQSDLYLTNFSWEHNPPNIPVVNYTFTYVHECEALSKC
jgi:hypothetical protein